MAKAPGVAPFPVPIPVPTTNNSPKRYAEYTVEELTNLTILQRIQLYDWRVEAVTLLFTIAFVVLYKIGDVYNQSLVTKYLKGLERSFTKNFFQYGVTSDKLYVKDSSENYSSYATGRANIAKVDLTFRLVPRHNIFVWILETVMSFFTENIYAPVDKVEIVITPSKDVQYENFIAAIVSKIGMNDFRKFNYYLSLTKTSDSANLPESFVYMGEANEFQDKITTPELKQALSVQAASFLNYVAFTDQPVERPENLNDLIPKKRVIISTGSISNKDQLNQLNSILDAVFNLIDKLAAKDITFKSEALKKVVKARETEVAKINKAREELKKEELLAEKAKLRKQERDRLRNLSSEEQAKLEKKALEKKQKKQQRKQRVKM
ncbi:DUF1682-domain-containing protein [Suhomyces tanzawaensis NRRL Y-17324]|uniref:DUF1682-domain-containing protein n=1 Tax=Suhomyces tanzawaensis NRRL Y-17324 TaxID=984487 RepID=A0A1E4SL25_9ASCO|nr:DUF1682-domain-containing protein [Suhomyces tanzawaensis NRRL Y-17324]ODV80188.1 DUF1682-domain-containing protein [Suhomyces tanzawaensis NRRL Y-17324]